MQFLFAPFAPPLRGLPCPAPLGAALRAAVDDPRSARGWPPPLRPGPRRWSRRDQRSGACAGGWPFLAPPSSRHTSWSGRARRRLGRCPRREDRRGSCRHGGILRGGFSRALVPPTTKRVGGLRVGARAEMRYAAARREPNPASDPRSSRHASRSGLAYARRSNPPDGGFPTPLVRPRLPRPFFGQNRSLLGLWRPPRLNFAQKTASEGAARPPATRPAAAGPLG